MTRQQGKPFPLSRLGSLIEKRYSERAFQRNAALLPGEIERIVCVALHAPSPSGRNPFCFVLLEDRGLLATLATEIEEAFDLLRESARADSSRLKTIEYYERHSLFVRNAGAVLLCYTNDRESILDAFLSCKGGEAANLLSLGAVLQNIGLLCTESGIGHCILSAVVELAPELFARICPAPEHLTLRCLVAFGKPVSEGRSIPGRVRVHRHLKVIGK
ncbi:MAG: nitroreductase family protein [Syntrophobacteraceae bacterium]|nr:nitroreductase family protein [Desulfobacteraceae bacterium]